jgi:hypothetical protein
MAEATPSAYCGTCKSEVPAAKNPHRVRNTAAVNFAAANLGLVSSDCGELATGPYVCPLCGAEVEVGHHDSVHD